MAKTGPARNKKQREYDLQEISSLYLQGWFQAKIADHISESRPYKITQQTISRDIKTIQERWLASSVRDFDEARAQELAKIDNLEIIYFEQWITSQDLEETGNPRFLQGIQWCIDRRCKLLGLDAPIKNHLTGQVTLTELTDEQLKRIVAGEDIADIVTE